MFDFLWSFEIDWRRIGLTAGIAALATLIIIGSSMLVHLYFDTTLIFIMWLVTFVIQNIAYQVLGGMF